MTTVQYHQPNQQPFTGDSISTLPIDQSQATHNEMHIIDTLFTKHASTMDKLVVEAKDSIIIGVLFVLFSLPVSDDLVKKLLPITTKSPYILVGIKAIAVMAFYWLIKHFYLSRKGT